MENLTYLGDAVYAFYDGYGIELRLNNHQAVCEVYLEPSVYVALTEFAVQIKAEGQ